MSWDGSTTACHSLALNVPSSLCPCLSSGRNVPLLPLHFSQEAPSPVHPALPCSSGRPCLMGSSGQWWFARTTPSLFCNLCALAAGPLWVLFLLLLLLVRLSHGSWHTQPRLQLLPVDCRWTLTLTPAPGLAPHHWCSHIG